MQRRRLVQSAKHVSLQTKHAYCPLWGRCRPLWSRYNDDSRRAAYCVTQAAAGRVGVLTPRCEGLLLVLLSRLCVLSPGGSWVTTLAFHVACRPTCRPTAAQCRSALQGPQRHSVQWKYCPFLSSSGLCTGQYHASEPGVKPVVHEDCRSPSPANSSSFPVLVIVAIPRPCIKMIHYTRACARTEREGDRQTDRHRDRQTDRDRERSAQRVAHLNVFSHRKINEGIIIIVYGASVPLNCLSAKPFISHRDGNRYQPRHPPPPHLVPLPPQHSNSRSGPLIRDGHQAAHKADMLHTCRVCVHRL